MFFAIGNLLGFVLAIIAGMVVGALAVVAAKQFVNPSVQADEAPALATA